MNRNAPATGAAIGAVVLDMGGVVIRLQWDVAAEHLRALGAAQPERLPSLFKAWQAHHRYETGKLTSAGFLAALGERLGLNADVASLQRAWNAITGPAFPGVLPLLSRVAERVPLLGFSNTNPLHLPLIKATLGEPNPFHHIHASHELGHHKPEPAAYAAVAAAVLAAHDVPAERILFVDDTAANVEAARAAGWQAEQSVNDPVRLEAILRDYGVL